MSDLDDVHRIAALHRLVDNLPVEAFDPAFRVLENYAKWPPKGHADAEQMLGKRESVSSDITKSMHVAQEQGLSPEWEVVRRSALMDTVIHRQTDGKVKRPLLST